MKKPNGKRLQQGVTSALVVDKLLLLSTQGKVLQPVSRADLLEALAPMKATTLDNRLRHLVQSRRVVRVGRSRYLPAIPASVCLIPSKPPGTVASFFDVRGHAVRVQWLGQPEPQPAPPARNPVRAATPPTPPERFDFEQARRRPKPRMK